jgi:hypothetical protein
MGWPSCRHNFPLEYIMSKVTPHGRLPKLGTGEWTSGTTHRTSTLEDDGFLSWALGIAKCTDSLSRFVWVCGQEIVQPVMANVR